MADEQMLSKLYRIRRTAVEMLRDREYLVTDSEIKMSKIEFINKFGREVQKEDLNINKSKKNDPTNQVHSLNLEFFFHNHISFLY